MRIQKFLHSCILIEEKGKRLLIDPGAFCFIEKRITPKDIGPVDVILLTHQHPDHYFPEALKEFVEMAPLDPVIPVIISNHEICGLLKKEGIASQSIRHGETTQAAGFVIEAFEAPHGRLSIPCPHNMAFRINRKLVHPGDSFVTAGLHSCDVLALPVAGPWATVIEGLEFAEKLRPKVVIPIHDAIIKDFMLERMYTLLCEPYLKNAGIRFSPLNLGEVLEV